MIGKHVIVRAHQAGVFFGILKEKNGQEVLMRDVRKIYSWSGAAAVEEISQIGSRNPEKCKLTVKVDEILVDGSIQVLPCTDTAIEVLQNIPEWKA